MEIRETEGKKVYGFQWVGKRNEENSGFEYLEFETPWNEVIEYLKWYEEFYGCRFINKYWVYNEEGEEIEIRYN